MGLKFLSRPNGANGEMTRKGRDSVLAPRAPLI